MLNNRPATHEEVVSITLKDAAHNITKSVVLIVRNGVTLHNGNSLENLFRKSIEAKNGLEKKVLTDLYRNLVRGNFTQFNGKRGTLGEQEMLLWFPDYRTLPNWKHQSSFYNGNGAILKYLLDSGEKAREEDLILAGYLVALIKENAWGGLTQLTYDPNTLKRIEQLAKRKTNEPMSPVQPVRVNLSDFRLPEEITSQDIRLFREGATTQITVNRYERDPKARKRCIEYYGTSCLICGFNFESFYGSAGRDIIHVHHLQPISTIGQSREVDPIRDLRPVCPNCHTMIHRREPIYSLEEVKEMLLKASQKK